MDRLETASHVMSIREMAIELGRTHMAVQGKVRRLRLRVGDK